MCSTSQLVWSADSHSERRTPEEHPECRPGSQGTSSAGGTQRRQPWNSRVLQQTEPSGAQRRGWGAGGGGHCRPLARVCAIPYVWDPTDTACPSQLGRCGVHSLHLGDLGAENSSNLRKDSQLLNAGEEGRPRKMSWSLVLTWCTFKWVQASCECE